VVIQSLLVLAAGLAAGTLAGWLIGSARAGRREESARLDRVRALTAAESALATERARRGEAEAELREARGAALRERGESAALRERAEAADRAAREQREFLERSRKELDDSFRSLATLALRGNTEEFLRLAEERWATTREQAARDLDDRRRGIEMLLAPLKETLGQLEHRTAEIERAREGAYRGLERELEGIRRAATSLEEKTTSLTSALRGTKTQGRWGELALRNLVELAGMSEHVDFEEQEGTPDGRRPDMVVRLPGGRFLAVDAKVSLNAYLDAQEAGTEEARLRALDAHAAAVRSHVRALAARDYAGAVEGDLDLVVLFLPGDPLLAAAFERDPDLQTDALRAKVIVATPATLFALLRTVAIYWQQRSLAENAQRIADVARDLYDRAANFGGHLDRMGRGLEEAVDAFNQAVGSFERRFLPMGRRLEELRAAPSGKELAVPRPVEDKPRRLVVAAEDGLAALPLFDAAAPASEDAGADPDSPDDVAAASISPGARPGKEDA
jgi:DNA recombination protein RmuC